MLFGNCFVCLNYGEVYDAPYLYHWRDTSKGNLCAPHFNRRHIETSWDRPLRKPHDPKNIISRSEKGEYGKRFICEAYGVEPDGRHWFVPRDETQGGICRRHYDRRSNDMEGWDDPLGRKGFGKCFICEAHGMERDGKYWLVPGNRKSRSICSPHCECRFRDMEGWDDAVLTSRWWAAR